jgi:hypothetical protein
LVKFNELYLAVVIGWQHIEMKQQPIGFVLDGLRQSGLAPCPPEHGEWPMIDVDRHRFGRLGVDANQADDGAEIDDAIDAYP